MNDKIKAFLQQNKYFIRNNMWEEIYQKALHNISFNTGDLTEALLEANIHPEYYLKELPNGFLYKCDRANFDIPYNITSIGLNAFAFCEKLTNITIPDKVTAISNYAFYYCVRLTSVTIPYSVTSIGDQAFTYCGNDKLVIEYSGNKEAWKKIYNPNAFQHISFTVNCTDGKRVQTIL